MRMSEWVSPARYCRGARACWYLAIRLTASSAGSVCESIWGVPRDKASLVRLARQRLPAVVADRWAGLLRPSFHLRAAVYAEAPVGRVLGGPALPDGRVWPRFGGRGSLGS